MKKFRITTFETVSDCYKRTYIVEAETAEEAENLIEEGEVDMENESLVWAELSDVDCFKIEEL